jgi:radical SAM protein with 4Fe4S-binding SPASM domain
VAHGVFVTGCIVVTRQNAAQVGEIIALWRQIGARQVALSRFSPAGMSIERMQSWLPRRRDLVTAFEQAQPFARDGMPICCTVPVPECLFDQSQFAPIRFGQCAIGSRYQEFVLGPDGALRLCTLHAGRLAGGRDVLDEDWDLATVMGSPEVMNYRRRLPEFCQGCAMANSCLGGCSASSIYRDNGEPRALDPLVQQYFDEAPTLLPIRRIDTQARTGAEP